MRTESQPEAPGLLERTFVFSVLLLSTGAFMSLTVTRGQGQVTAAGDGGGMQLVWMGIYIVAVVLLWRKCRGALRESCQEYLLVALAVLALGSTAWSDDPGVSLRRGIALVLTCLFGVYLGSRFSLSEQLRLCASVCAVCVVSSLMFGILGLGNPVEDVAGWYGIFVHKNVLGRMMVLSILIFLMAAKTESKRKSQYLFATGLACVLLLLSRSATSLVVLAAMLAFLVSCPVLRRSKSGLIKASIAGLVVFGIGVHWASQNLEYILGLFGKDLTLTGRLQLWVLSTVMAMQKPWLGHGYSAFWLGPGSPSARILAVVQWDAPHAHNGLLEIWLEIGLIGVALFLAGFICYVGRALSFLRRSRSPEAIWPLCFLTFMFLSNLTESDYLARNTIFWILYVAAIVTLRREEDTHRTTASDFVRRPAPQRLAVPRTCQG